MRYLLLCICLLPFLVRAQEDTTVRKKSQWSFLVGTGASYQFARDRGMSSLRYQGVQTASQAEILWKRSRNEHRLVGRFDYGTLEAERNGSEVTAYRGGGYYRFLQNGPRFWKNRLQVSYGGSLDGFWNLRYHTGYSNNAYNNEFYLSLAPVAQIEFPFRFLKQQFKLSYTAHLPLATYVVRQGFSGTYFDAFVNEEVDGVKGALQSGYMSGWGTFKRFYSEFGLEYTLKNGNGMRLVYTWDYYRLDSRYNPVEAGVKGGVFSIIYQF